MYILVLDTEAAQLRRRLTPFNVGYVIGDARTGDVIVERDYVIEEPWRALNDAPSYDVSFIGTPKHDRYKERVQAGTLEVAAADAISRILFRDMVEWGVDCIYAHNAPFDRRACGVLDIPASVPWRCTMRGWYAVMPAAYKRWCKNTHHLTRTGKPSATAENICRFLFKDNNFKEEHTALADARVEFAIARYELSRHRRVKWGKYATI
jgi:hypothetical protein